MIFAHSNSCSFIVFALSTHFDSSCCELEHHRSTGPFKTGGREKEQIDTQWQLLVVKLHHLKRHSMSNLEGKSHSFFTLDAESLWRKHHSLKSTEFRLKVEKRSRRKSMETLLDELGWMTMEDNSSSANTSSSERGYTSVEPAMSNYTIRVDTPSDEERHTSRPVTSEESDYDSDGSAQIESRSSTSLSINVDPSAHTVAWASQSVHHRALVPLEGNLRRKTRETAVPVSLNNRRGIDSQTCLANIRAGGGGGGVQGVQKNPPFLGNLGIFGREVPLFRVCSLADKHNPLSKNTNK